jgi:Mlc titration factor MtfA (ptsG expression regulator)
MLGCGQGQSASALSLATPMRFHRGPKGPFPPAWRAVIEERFVPLATLDDDERSRLEVLTRELIDRKNWEAAKDFTVTEDMQVTVAVHAALLILELDHSYYKGVSAIIMHPTTMVLTGERAGPASGVVTNAPMQILGQANLNGPITIAWDSVTHEARHPERGHNVVYHEFAHKLDMLNGSADGVPPLSSRDEYEGWNRVCTHEYELLHSSPIASHLLRDYAGVNPAEFFAVITEVFFDKPKDMKHHKRELYDVLAAFYRQDPASRTVRS